MHGLGRQKKVLVAILWSRYLTNHCRSHSTFGKPKGVSTYSVILGWEVTDSVDYIQYIKLVIATVACGGRG